LNVDGLFACAVSPERGTRFDGLITVPGTKAGKPKPVVAGFVVAGFVALAQRAVIGTIQRTTCGQIR